MYPEKFAELAALVREFAADAADDAIERAAGELLVGLGQCKSEEDAGPLAARVFGELLGKKLAPADAMLTGAKIFRWRAGWTDVLY